LLKQKTAELNSLKGKTKQLTQKYAARPYLNSAMAATDELCLGVISEGDRGKKHRSAIEEAQCVIDAVTTWKQFRQLTTLFETQLQNALQNSAAIRIATEKPSNQPLPSWITSSRTKTNIQKRFQLKILPNIPTATLTIFDSTQAAIALNNTITYTKGPHLWTNNPTILAMTQTYFNATWNQT
jgi:CMP-N-acetylneuraminic acid synthetase